MAGLRVDVQRDIIAEAADVWTVLTDINRYARVLRAVETVERVSGEGFDLGVTWRETRRVMGRLEALDVVVVLCDPGRRTVLESTHAGTVYRAEFSLHPSGVGTRLRNEFVAESPDITAMRRVAWTLFGGAGARATKQALDEDLEDFSRAVER